MIGQQIPRLQALVFGVAAVAVLAAVYTLLAASQHRKNPDDRTIPTLRQLGDGIAFLCRQPRAAELDASDLLAAALEGSGIEAPGGSRKDGFMRGRVLWEASKATMGRLLGGLGVGLAGGVLLGILMGCFPRVDASASPVMYFASRVIATAAMPIFFKLAGIDLRMYVAMIAFGSMPIVTLTVAQYVREFPEELRYKA